MAAAAGRLLLGRILKPSTLASAKSPLLPVANKPLPEGVHRSVVACLLRASPSAVGSASSSDEPAGGAGENTEMFFCLRAINERDRWSGQVPQQMFSKFWSKNKN